MGRPRKYTARTLDKAVRAYFDSISRTQALTESVDTGEKDDFGHRIFQQKIICNDAGEPIRVKRFIAPASVNGLCRFLGIHRCTWWEYCDGEKHPELVETVQWARETLEGYLVDEVLSRSGKDLKGVLFLLQNCYGWSEKRQVELGPRARRAVTASVVPLEEREAILREIAREFGKIEADDKQEFSDGPVVEETERKQQ